MNLDDFILYFSPLVGFYLKDFSFKESIFLLLSSFSILYIINPLFKRFFQYTNLTIFGDICRPLLQCSELSSLKTIGMPSGHTQTIVFITMFLYIKYRNFNKVVKIFSLLSVFMMYSRVHSNKHTINQVIVGALLIIILFKFNLYTI